MNPRVLTPEQIEQFITSGWTKIPQAFPREVAVSCQDFLWEKLSDPNNVSSKQLEHGILKNDPATWTLPMAFIGQGYNGAPFDACATQKLADACSDLVGSGRWINEHEVGWWGHWPVNFAIGADQIWDVPADEWHIDTPDDGTFISAPNQGSLAVCLFSKIGPRGGGTLICEGSHQIAIRFMKENPGLTQRDFNHLCAESHPYLRALSGRDGGAGPGTDTGNARGVNAAAFVRKQAERLQNAVKTERISRFMDEVHTDEWGTKLRVVEITGEPGDVFLAHPFMFHSPSFNHSGVPRFMCNRKTPLFEPMQLQRADAAEYSALEESIRRALEPVGMAAV